MTIYETGATSHEVNELVLFTQNTAELAAMRDSLFMKFSESNPPHWKQFYTLLDAAKSAYRNDVITQLARISEEQEKEFCILYCSLFKEWKREEKRVRSPFRYDSLTMYADKLKGRGLDVYYCLREDKLKQTFFYFTDGKNIGYCQVDENPERLRLSTVHKPSMKAGTGYAVQEPWQGLIEPGIEHALQAFAFLPPKAQWSIAEHVTKWTDFHEWWNREKVTGTDYLLY